MTSRSQQHGVDHKINLERMKIRNRISYQVHAVNASNLIEKCILDLRNIFLNQEHIRKFFSKTRRFIELRKIFSSLPKESLS